MCVSGKFGPLFLMVVPSNNYFSMKISFIYLVYLLGCFLLLTYHLEKVEAIEAAKWLPKYVVDQNLKHTSKILCTLI